MPFYFLFNSNSLTIFFVTWQTVFFRIFPLSEVLFRFYFVKFFWCALKPAKVGCYIKVSFWEEFHLCLKFQILRFCFLREKCKQYLYPSPPFWIKTVRFYLMDDEKCLVANKYDPILCNKFTIGGLVQPHWILKSIQMVANRSSFKRERPIFPCKNIAIKNPHIRFCTFW